MNIRLNINVLLGIAIAILVILTIYWWNAGAAKPLPTNKTLPVSSEPAAQADVLPSPITTRSLPALHDPTEIKASINTSLTASQAQNTGIKLGAEHEQTDEILRDVNQMNVELGQLLTQEAGMLGFTSLDAETILSASKALITQVDQEYGTDSVAYGLQWRASLAAIDDPELQGLNDQRKSLDQELETIINSFQ